MTIANLYFQNIQTKPKPDFVPEASAKSEKKDSDFKNFLDSVEKTDNPVKKSDPAASRNKADNRRNSDKANKAKDSEKLDNANNGSSEKTAVEDPGTKEVGKKEPVQTASGGKEVDSGKDGFSEDEFNAACKEIIDKLAMELNIPVENIQQMLIALNIKPLELLDAANLNSFVQKVVGADSAQQMLTMPDVQDVFSKVGSVIDEYKEIAQSFMDKLENDQIGRPKFIDSGERTNQAVFVSANAVQKDIVQVSVAQVSADEAEIPAEVKDAVETDGNVEKPMPVSNDNPEAFGAGANSNSGGNNAEEALLNTNNAGDSKQSVTPISTSVAANVEFEKAMIKNESIRNIDTQDVIDQIINRLKVEVKADTTEIKLTLKPEHLGDVTLKVLTQNGVVTAQFVAENQRVKEVIEAGFNQLRENLQEQGINISQLSVSVGQENAEKQLGQFMQNQEKSSARVNQIINNSSLMTEQVIEKTQTYIHGNEIYDIKVDYKA